MTHKIQLEISTDLERPKSPEHGTVQCNVDPDNTRMDGKSDYSTAEDDSESDFILTPPVTPFEDSLTELWVPLHTLASEREKDYTTTEDWNTLNVRITTRIFKINDATKESATHSQLPSTRSSWHDTAKRVIDSISRKNTEKREQLEQSSVGKVTNSLELSHFDPENYKTGIESSEIPAENTATIHAERSTQMNFECATKREKGKDRQEQDKATKEAKSKSKATETQEGAPQKVSKYIAKRNRRKATKEQQKALEEADNIAIAEAKRATMRDLMVPGQRQAYEQRKKDHVAQSQKAEEIRKAAQLRQNARIAQREAGIPLMVAHELEESTKPATNIAALIIQAHQQEESTKLAQKIEAPIKLASNGHLSRMTQAREASIKLASITIPTFSKDYSAVMKEYMGWLHPSVSVKFASHAETQRWIITALLKRSFEQKDNNNNNKDGPTKLGYGFLNGAGCCW
jgi:hypothetical protein